MSRFVPSAFAAMHNDDIVPLTAGTTPGRPFVHVKECPDLMIKRVEHVTAVRALVGADFHQCWNVRTFRSGGA